MRTDFAAAGLGLRHGTVRLVPARPEWAAVASQLAAGIADALPALVVEVAHIGSSAVPGLLAKPVVDFAVGVRPDAAAAEVAEWMARLGWLYQGDAGPDGGWVFVLEDSPSHRVAHAHGVEHGGVQWLRYLRFLELLRSSPDARRAYELAKQDLAAQHPDDRREYTAGKAGTVQRLLSADE